jgi:hypothetical protein
MRKISAFAALFLAVMWTLPLFADKDELHQALDRRYRFQKRFQNELGFRGGAYLGNQTQTSWIAGGYYYFHLNNTFAVGGAYNYSPIEADSNSTFGQSLTNKNMHLMSAELMISNDAAFRAGKSIVECDLYFTLGAGSIWINRHYEPMGVIGGGMKIYTGWPWLVPRIDINTYIHPTPNNSGTTYDGDVATLIGLSFVFPEKKVEDIEPEEDAPVQ